MKKIDFKGFIVGVITYFIVSILVVSIGIENQVIEMIIIVVAMFIVIGVGYLTMNRKY